MPYNSLLEADLKSLDVLIQLRVKQLISEEPIEIKALFSDVDHFQNDYYAVVLQQAGLNIYERISLILSLAVYLQPEYLDYLYLHNPATKTTYTQVGGRSSTNTSAFLPTGETALFLCAGTNFQDKIALLSLFSGNGALYQNNLVSLQAVEAGEPPLSGRIIPTEECLQFVINGTSFKPNYNSNFPAKLLSTPLDWEDLVLTYDTKEGLEELEAWLANHTELAKMTSITRKFKRGYRALLHGPSGTGKTLTASLLGKRYGMDVYHIDLSMLVSKYIGETEKNLKQIFDLAENKDWILFFDEADSIFGKRTSTQSSNDRYANQEISYLLQRIEDFPGLIILASNLKANMDKAFLRRFQSSVYFPVPGVEERYLLWQKAFGDTVVLEDEIDLRKIAKEHELTGAVIGNILRYCVLMSMNRDDRTILLDDIERAIRRELMKEGKSI